MMGLALLTTQVLAQSIDVPYTFTTIAGPSRFPIDGNADGIGSAARFFLPYGVAVDSGGIVYVAEPFAARIRKLSPVGTNWVVTTIAWPTTGPPLQQPFGVAAGSAGVVYVTDFATNLVFQLTPVGTNWAVTTLAGKPGGGAGDGTGTNAGFNGPMGVAVDGTNNIYVADFNNNTIRKITRDGVVTTLAGMAGMSGSTDGTGSVARLNNPAAVAVDGAGNIYVGEGNQYTSTIRKITPVGTNWVVTTLAVRQLSPGGSGTNAPGGPSGGIAVDSAGNVYTGDAQTIWKASPTGAVTIIAHGNTGSADGTGTFAQFLWPNGVAVDNAGNLYITDGGNDNIREGHRENAPAVIVTPNLPVGSTGGQFGFMLTGPPGQLVVVEASADLLTWVPVVTNTFLQTPGLNFSDPQSGVFSNRFYRARTP